MGLDELKGEIISKAEAEAGRILAAARKEADAIRAQAEAEAERRGRDADIETSRQVEALRQRELAAVALERKKWLMAAKRQVMDEAFAEAEKQLVSLSGAERRRLLDSLLARASSEITVARVRCNPKDVKAFDGVATLTTEIKGGLIAENEDGTISVDYSFETLLEETREHRLEELARILFGADGTMNNDKMTGRR